MFNCFLLCSCITEDLATTITKEPTPTADTIKYKGNMGVEYTEENGKYICKGIVYKYKKTLTGRGNGAVKDSTFIVLTNNNNVTFHNVWWSLISSNSDDWLADTVIIDMK